MANYSLIDASGLIKTRVVLDDLASWTVPQGLVLVEETAAPFDVGGTIIDGSYAPPASVPKPFPAIDPIDTWNVVSLKIAFNHENRIRALEGKAAITLAQFKTAVKAQL